MKLTDFHMRPDADKIAATFDEDGEEEPPAARIDFAQKDKIKIKIRAPFERKDTSELSSRKSRRLTTRLNPMKLRKRSLAGDLNISIKRDSSIRRDSSAGSMSSQRGNSIYERIEPASATRVSKKEPFTPNLTFNVKTQSGKNHPYNSQRETVIEVSQVSPHEKPSTM